MKFHNMKIIWQNKTNNARGCHRLALSTAIQQLLTVAEQSFLNLWPCEQFQSSRRVFWCLNPHFHAWGSKAASPTVKAVSLVCLGLQASALLGTTEILSAQGINGECSECFYLKKKKKKVEEEECKPQALNATYTVEFSKSHSCPHSPS